MLTDTRIVIDTTVEDRDRPHGLLSAAHEITNLDSHFIFGGVTYNSVCADPAKTTAVCVDMPTEKEATGPVTVDLASFILYGLYSCKAIGSDDHAIRSAALLEAGEQTAVEAQFADRMLADAGTTTGTATNLVELLATAEDTWQQGVQPVIHTTPGNVVRLSAQGVLSLEGGVLRTYNGTPVVSGAGYVGKGFDLAVTGTVRYARGGVTAVEPQIDRSTNDIFALSERGWAVGHDCNAYVYSISTG